MRSGLLLAIASLAGWAQSQDALVPNPSFEAGEGERPEAWQPHTYGGEASFEWVEGGRSGDRSVKVQSENGADAAWRVAFEVHPYSVYRLSGWVRTDDLVATTGRGALLNVHGLAGARTLPLTGDTGWTRLQVEFATGPRTRILVNCLFGGWGSATGTAFFDDVALELLQRGDPERPTAVLRLDRELGEISQYVYGQFIEHLGRCIYGGVWAEMLQDRKFFRRVGAPDSPWRRGSEVGGWSLDMDVERPFANGWSVAIRQHRLPESTQVFGISQDGLGLLAGKEYLGYVWLRGEGIVQARLAWEGGHQDVQLPCDSEDFQRHELRFRAGATTEDGVLELGLRGAGSVWIGSPSLMPADNVHGMRADTLALLRELDSPIYRWPGGNFVSGYDWRDGIGPRDRRPTRRNPAWQGLEPNDFGIDEFLVFCRELGTEPLVVVNTGLGSPYLSAALVEYCNGGPDTKRGEQRAANGHVEPYGVEWWGVGNEMYGDWQLGNVSLVSYVIRHEAHVQAIHAVDPEAKLIAVGASGRWSRTMLEFAYMDLLSEHFYCQERRDVGEHVAQIPEAVRAKALAHRGYLANPKVARKPVPIALDEWNYWYGEHRYGELGVRYHLKDALGIAAGLHEMVRHRDLFFMANYAQTVNVLGCIKTSKTAACFATTGLPLMLYRREFGVEALAVEGHPAPLDVAAALRLDGKISLAVVNPLGKSVTLKLDVRGGGLGETGTRYRIAGPDPMAFNEPGAPASVEIQEEPVSGFDPAAAEVAPYSVTLWVLEKE